MNPGLTFTIGLIILGLLGWYLCADSTQRKRSIGTIVALVVIAFCLNSAWPPFDIKDAAGKLLKTGKIHLGLDLQGGTSFQLQLVHDNGKKITPDMLNQAVEVIRKRIDRYGVSEPSIAPIGEDRISVEIPGLDNDKITEAKEQIEKVAKLEFHYVHPDSAELLPQIQAGTAIIPPGYVVMDVEEQGKPPGEKMLVEKNAAIEGNDVANAFPTYGPAGQLEVGLSFKTKGADLFAELTKRVAQTHSLLAIVLDGKVVSAAGVDLQRNPAGIIGGSAIISGQFTQEYVRNLASVLNNPLQTPVHIDETRSASATLGQDAIHSGIYAGIGGLILVLIFVALYYRFAGIVAIFGLIVNVVVLFGVMAMFNFTLTLPGIAGVILTIGLAIDANVLIYERLREEIAAGKTLAAAIEAAYDKAFSVILDANVTTLITAAILFWKASGPVKGFAVTLTVGILASVFVAMIVTRTCFGWALKLGLSRIKMHHLIPSDKRFDFLGKRRIWIAISLTVIVISAGSFYHRGQKNFGIDFTGGDMLLLAPKTAVTDAEVRDALAPIGLAGQVELQHESEPLTPTTRREYLSIRSPQNTSNKILDQLAIKLPSVFPKDTDATPPNELVLHKEDHVGAVVGGEMARSSLLAFGLAMLGILIYVTLRFEVSFAIGALVALLHDVIITVGVFAFFGKELSLIMVGAILTIAGYSINDTIVVYDRIREGLHRGRKGSIVEIMNASINETLSRTLLTSGCTLLSVASLFFFGGAVLHDFAFAILIGIVVGTYSSIFIASPIVLWWSGHKGSRLHTEVERSKVFAGGGANR